MIIRIPDGRYYLHLRDSSENGGVSGEAQLAGRGSPLLSWKAYHEPRPYRHCDMRQWNATAYNDVIASCVGMCYANASETNFTKLCDNSLGSCPASCAVAVEALQKQSREECLTEGFLHHSDDELSFAYTAGNIIATIRHIFLSCGVSSLPTQSLAQCQAEGYCKKPTTA